MGPMIPIRRGRTTGDSPDDDDIPQESFRVSAVIPLRDRPSKHLAAALWGLKEQRLPLHEIIVVDQASRPSLRRQYAEVIRRHPRARHLVRETPDRWNKPMAANVGLRAVSEDTTHVLCLDCDMIFAPSATQTLRVLAEKYRGQVLVHGHRHDLIDPDKLMVRPRWKTLERSTRLTDVVGHPWHFAPRKWFWRVRGYDERMWGRGAMDNDLTARGERDPHIAVLRLPEKQILAVHYSHGRPPWTETHKRPETALNCRLRNTDPSIVRNDESWGTR